ncbi:MAG: hypothetical protein KDK27_02350 [Leptospiraceae bacterium]|nr:hypothetical protein [Leptospiraceae bacterium]
MQTSATDLLEADLQARINPEKSRHFERHRLHAARERLMEFARLPELAPIGERITIAGSNGKGSTAFFLSGLATHFLRDTIDTPIALYSSPHLLNVRERIRFDQQPISAAAAWEGLCALRDLLPNDYAGFSYFEILTLLALYQFHQKHCDLQIFEVGLGGRYDATRMAAAQTVILTRIEKEHTAVLGDTYEQILREKLGVMTPRCELLIVLPQNTEVQSELIRSIALDCQSDVHIEFVADRSENRCDYLELNRRQAVDCLRILRQHRIGSGNPHASSADTKADTSTRSIPVMNDSSRTDESLARNEIIVRSLANESLFDTMERTALPAPMVPPGRLERRALRQTHIPVLFDVAHNPPAITRVLRDCRLASTLADAQECLVILAMIKGRDPDEIVRVIQAAGYAQIVQLNTAEFVCGNLAPVMEVPVLERHLWPTGEQSAYGAILMLGTHRSYEYFIRWTEPLSLKL